MKYLILFLLIFSNAESIQAKDFKQVELIFEASDGKNFDLKTRLGKVVIVNFWVSWCGNCKAEMAILKELRNEYKIQDLEIIGVSIDNKRSYDDFLKVAVNLNYPNFIIHDAKVNSFGEPIFLPTTYIIDKNGDAKIIKISQEQALNKEDFKKIIEKELSS